MSYQALLFCPDEKTARVVTQVLNELDFTVEPCHEPFAAVKKLMAQHFDALVVDCENQQNAMLLFKSARNSGSNQSSLAVAVVEGQAGVAQAFRIGANLVLTKPINVEQSKGTLRVARGLLRKADAGKPTPPPAEAPPATSSRPAATEKPVVTKAPPVPATPVASGSQFELEEEPAPKPEPAEAALLETMSDSLPPAAAGTTSKPMREYPWQPASKLAEPMASALRRAAEAAAKPAEPLASATDEAEILEIDEEPSTQGAQPISASPVFSDASHGAASAPAPARQTPRPIPIAQPKKEVAADTLFTKEEPAVVAESHGTTQVEPPAFTFGGQEPEEAEASHKKLPFIIVAAAIVLIATAYYSWNRMNSKSQVPAQPPATTTAPATPQAPESKPSAAVPVAAVPSATAVIPHATETVQTPAPSSSKVSESPKASANSPSSASSKPAAEEPSVEPIMVKSSTARPAAPKPAEPESVQAPDLALSAGSGETTISGLVASTPTNVPKAAPQTVKISQGVSQGLLSKRVAPQYPAQAQQMRIQGSVELMATISKEGTISDVKVVSGHPILAKAAVDAVRQWKYKPYFLNGEPVEIQTQVTVKFQLP